MAETVLPEGWVVAAAPHLVTGRGLVCILRVVGPEALTPRVLLDKKLKIDGQHYDVIGYGGGGLADRSYEFTLQKMSLEKVKDPETVDHPTHYGGKDNVYEAIRVIEAWELGFCLGNTVKYISRAGKKDPTKTLEDLRKARWYLQREIENLEKVK